MNRAIQQYVIESSVLSSEDAEVEETILYREVGSASNNYEAPANGEATIIFYLVAASQTEVTISAKNLYGDLEEESFWEVEKIIVGSGGVHLAKMLHISMAEKYDPNASGIKIKIARSESVDVTYKGRLLRA